jgi:radical SAM protein (TIGR01212 family)
MDSSMPTSSAGAAAGAEFPYNKFSDYLKEHYGCRVYKIPVAVPCSCPNRDGSKGTDGCIFCGEEAAGFESLAPEIPVSEQLRKNISYMGNKYKAGKFIAYFQNFSNTYMELGNFKEYMKEACIENIVAVYISTRPDCINEFHAAFLEELSDETGVDVVLEMGLQSASDISLMKLGRGHTVKDFEMAAGLLHRFGIPFCAHMINDLPFEKNEQVALSAGFLNSIGTAQVKCHSLYVIKGTKLADMYQKGEIHMLNSEDFIERTILFLRNLDKKTVVQRLMGRAPAGRTLFCNYGRSWRAVVDEITIKMKENGWRQGDLI